MPEVTAGAHTRINTVWEDAGFNTDPETASTLAWGYDLQLNTSEGTNGLERVVMPGSREALELITTVFDGSFALEFTLADPWWAKGVLGNASTSGSAAPYTHTYDADNGNDPVSFQIIEGYERGPHERTLTGCVPTRVTVESNLQEKTTVTIEGAYASENIDKNVDSLTAQSEPDLDKPMTYIEGSLSIDGTTEKFIQSMSLTLEANIEPVREHGVRTFVDYLPKLLEPNIQFDRLKDDDTTSLEEVYGGAEAVQDELGDGVNVQMTYDNGGADAEKESTMIELAGSKPESYDEGGVGDPMANVEESLNRQATEIDIIAENDVEAAP